MTDESFQKLHAELRKMTKKQIIERELARQGYAMEAHSCVTCEFYKIWGTDYSQYYDCTRDEDNYRQPGPEYIEQNRCLHYKKMEIGSCLVCHAPGIEKCLVLVQSPYQRDEHVPATGYWCGQCKQRYVLDGGKFVPSK
jgi:hypothetical protein